jgi:uncharacterized membrane protein
MHESDFVMEGETGPPEMLPVNLAPVERIASAAVGGALVVFGMIRRRWTGAAMATGGSYLVARAITGHCAIYEAMGVTTAPEPTSTAERIVGPDGIRVDKVVTVQRPAGELYAFWRELQNLPRIMSHILSVSGDVETGSHWTARGPGGIDVSWDAVVTLDESNRLISWQSIPGSQIINTGLVRFRELPNDRGTEVHVSLHYRPPLGILGKLVAPFFAEEPSRQIEEDLRRFKQIMEAGEFARANG